MRRGIARGSSDAVARASNAPESAWVRVSKRNQGQTTFFRGKRGLSLFFSFSGGALLSLRVLDVHLGVGAMRRGFGVADMHRQRHVVEHRAERREAQHHVVGAAAVAHQAEAPDLALERPEAGADLEAELGEQHAAHPGFVDALGTQYGIHLRQLIFFCNQEFHSHCFQASLQCEVVASTITSAPCLCAICVRSFASDWQPVEVSACTKATSFASRFFFSASSSFCGSTGSPHLSSTTTGDPPQRAAFSSMRPPKTPFWQTITLSPGVTMLTKQYSMPTEPGPDSGKVRGFFVW